MGHELRLEGWFDAPPEVVFDAFLDRRSIFSGEWGRSVDTPDTASCALASQGGQ